MGPRTTAQCIALLCVSALIPFDAFGWSAEAHRAIAIIAADRLQGTAAADRISDLLGALTLADIATCPDEVREIEQHEIKALSAPCAKIFPAPPKGTSQGHFVNTPIRDASFEPTAADINAACKDVCAIVEIDKFLAVLSASKPADTGAQKLQEAQALSFAVHFIGDIHQPLHAADRDGDEGGNAEHVTFFHAGSAGEIKLHGIWDNQIVARIDKPETKLAADLKPEIASAAQEPIGDPMAWTLQSYEFARDVAYAGVPAPPPEDKNKIVAELGQPYQDKAAPVVRMQIARAGVRLAASLQSALAQ